MLAVLYDVHGNLPALEAVLADAEQHGARRYLLGGDYCAFGAWPAETLARLKALPEATWIRGNWERWQGAPADAPATEVVQGAAQFVSAAIGDAEVAHLAALSRDAVIDGTYFCHASPRSDMDAFPVPGFEDPDRDDELLSAVEQRLVMFGHTHIQFQRETRAGVRLVNPGSTGLPWDGDRDAAYALRSPDGTVTLRRVAYDHEASARALDAIGEQWAAVTAARLRQARFDAV